MKRQYLRFFVSGALACLLILGVSQIGGAAQPSSLPGNVQQCVEEGVGSVELVGTVRESSRTFYYLRNYLFGSDDPMESWYSLIEVNSGQQCRRLMDGQADLTPLSHFMPAATARQLELQRYEGEIQAAGGRQAFQQAFNRRLSPPPYTAYEGVPVYLSEEQVWALRQLGIQFPDTYHLLTNPSNGEHNP